MTREEFEMDMIHMIHDIKANMMWGEPEWRTVSLGVDPEYNWVVDITPDQGNMNWIEFEVGVDKPTHSIMSEIMANIKPMIDVDLDVGC